MNQQQNTLAVPHNKEAEESLIGSIFINPDILPMLSTQADEFYIQRHKWIWEVIIHLHGKGMAIDLVTVSSELEKRGQLNEIGGAAYLTGLVSIVPSSLNAEDYAKIISDYAQRRRDINIANQIAKGAYGDGVDRAVIIDQLTRNTGISHGASAVSKGLNSFYSSVEERAKNPCAVWGIKSGIPSLDVMTGGWHAQQTTMIAGSPGVGKTTMLLQFLLKAAQHIPSAIYELEMDEERLIGRLVSMITGVPVRNMKSGHMEQHWESFNHGVEVLEKLPLYICDNPVMNTAQVRADVARLKSLYDIGFVGLDYLNLLTDRDTGDKNGDTNDKAVRFRSICREFEVAGISVQSVNKEGMRAMLPTLADMSGPAEVGFTADNVFFLVEHADKDKKGVFQLLPAKLRDGDMDRKPIEVIRPKGKLFYSEPARI